MSGIKVFSQPTCKPCDLVKSALDRAGIPYTPLDISTDAEARKEIADLGYTGTPVVYVDAENHWQGMKDDLLRALIKEHQQAA